MPTVLEREKQASSSSRSEAYTLRAFAYKQSHNLYVAECIDLNLMVKAKSMHQAVESLHNAVLGYLEVACNGDTKGLIPRRSPVARLLRYHWIKLKVSLADSPKERELPQNAPRTFLCEVPCSAAA
jgi:hypothetical protein